MVATSGFLSTSIVRFQQQCVTLHCKKKSAESA